MENDKIEKSKTTKFETVAIIVFILSGFIGFGYGALSVMDAAIKKISQQKNAPNTIKHDTVNYIHALDSIKKQRE